MRLRTHTPPLRHLVRLLTLVLGAAFVWYGAIVCLVATKALSAHSADAISGYLTLYRDIVSLRPADFTTGVRLIAGFGGLLVFLVFFVLTLQEIPRPRRAGSSALELDVDGRGRTVVRPGALARLAELAARGSDGVAEAGATARPDAVHVDVVVRDPQTVADTLSDVSTRVRDEFARHELPTSPVSVTLTNLDRTIKRRDLT